MYTRFTFYRSTEWRKLLDTLKAERLDNNGNIICEYCGKPIVRAYDCIGHHKEELTEENVNDYSVALNPDNIALVHHKCHNYIHNKFGHKQREVFIVYGAPLAGKSSWVAEAKTDSDLVIDMDNIWQCITGGERYSKPPKLNAVAFSIRNTLIEAVKYRQGKWDNAFVIGGYPLQAERERLARELGAREVLIEATEEECLARLEADTSGRDKDKWRGYIAEWFTRYHPPLSDI